MKKKPKLMTRSEEEKLFKKFMILTTAYLMEETEFNSEEKIIQFYTGLDLWLQAVNDHVITIKKVKDIIEEQTGLKVLF